MKITLEEARNSLSMETDCTTEVESVSVEIGELCSKVEAFDSSVIVKHQEHSEKVVSRHNLSDRKNRKVKKRVKEAE
ncbi:hypothetical protein ACET3Z_030578 [Daucus carota]